MRYRGRLASLLEVGTGFHRELTGRENIYLNGAILGMTRAEIDRQFDAIVEFAGVGPFLETPVKRYSSGMYVRLAFAVAAHLRTDILVVDEVLAVGDAEFQKKCLGKMQDVAHDGRTVLFVSHNMGAVASLCESGVMLSQGRLHLQGTASTVIQAYLDTFGGAGEGGAPGVYDLSAHKNPYRAEAHLLRVEIRNMAGELTSVLPCGEGFRLRVYTRGLAQYTNAAVGVIFSKGTLERLANFNTYMMPPTGTCADPNSAVYEMVVPEPNFAPGVYHLDISAAENNKERVDFVEKSVSFEVLAGDIYGTGIFREYQSAIFIKGEWRYL
jgi:lipopolysaccharide transport system ATP-binding protein